MSTTDQQPPLPSNARFGWLFAAIFAAIASYNFWVGQRLAAWICVGAAMVLIAVTMIRPTALQPLNRVWFAFGLLLGRIVSPLVLGILFFLIITPVALIGRAFGRDPLRMKRCITASYWIRRDPPGPALDSFKHQF
jgi:hypothetical protein